MLTTNDETENLSDRNARNERHGAVMQCPGGVLLFVACWLCGASLWQRVAWSAAPEREDLLEPKAFASQWFFFSADQKAVPEETWTLKKPSGNADPILICHGKDKPFGYLRTVKEYENFRFAIEWMYPKDVNGNSGVLIHTEPVGALQAAGDKIWPKSIQVQLHRPKTGSVFPSGGAKTDNTLDVKDLSAPVNHWNSCVVTSKDGTLTVTLNNKTVGRVTGCQPAKGSIALQCEGSEIQFRRIWVESLR